VSSLRSTIRLTALVAWTAVGTAAYAAAKPASRRLAQGVLRSWHRGALRIAGVRLAVRGAPCAAPGTLFVANHISYVDIPVLGAVAGVDFVAKADIAGWPVMGAIGRLIGTLYVDRRMSAAGKTRDALGSRLAMGDRMAMFPEGTTTDGRRVLPFRSAPFAALESAKDEIWVQPVSLRYVALDGLPLDRERRWQVAWCGDAELVPHIWQLFDSGAVVAEVEFHPAFVSAAIDRKTLAARCHAAVAAGVARQAPPRWWAAATGSSAAVGTATELEAGTQAL
jgi:1-acyl-sn-glycerol-3-phosphate acyltransferase